MPRYLRWIAAVSAAITLQFAFFILSLAIAVGTGEKADASGQVEVGGGIGLIISLTGSILSVVAALGVNDWLAKRYPLVPKGRAQPEATEPV